MKKLIRVLGLPIEKIDACKNSCILYWKDDINMVIASFVEKLARYKLTREQNPNDKKTSYAINILRYLSLTPLLQKLYASKMTAEHMTWHANHQTEEGSNVIRLMQRGGGISIGHISILQQSPIVID
ncbi:hypothetical protein Sango_1134700 [Sesamum angolense]|uniref:Uncharacterized protein n=1 Tax=Sesamum angolense TaxID=2727404 RepID=A0AAE1WVP4_9LAMI|nr:hypothetical protein Sango_1134700 [Sesamum angolense]